MPSIFKDTVEVFRSKYIMAQIYKIVVGMCVRERDGRMGKEREREMVVGEDRGRGEEKGEILEGIGEDKRL